MTNNSWQHIRGLWRAAEERPAASRGAIRALRRHFHEPSIVERMALLEDFLRQTERRPFVWGASDCSLMVADWCVANDRPDPAEAWRGAYTTEAECRALIAERGDLADVIAGCATIAGLKPIAEPTFGCVAVIGSPHNKDRQWAAIWSGCRWAVRWHSGETTRWSPFAAKALKMWEV